jgi:hypothetical protein
MEAVLADDADELRTIERQRLAAFVAKDVAALEHVHANDFQLINPAGQLLYKPDYLNGVAQGFIEYRAWEPESEIEAHVYAEVAVLHYRSRLEIAVQGEVQPPQHLWQTEVYEKRGDAWQAVWSQATRISV